MTNKLNIIFAGTPKFALPILEGLVLSRHNVCAVLTQPDRPKGRGRQLEASLVKAYALENNLPVHQPLSLKNTNIQNIIRQYNPDIFIVVAYGLIIPQEILDIPKGGCINVHASLLPRWRGAAPIQHAILAGDRETGITIMQMDKGLDTGDILLQQKYRIKKNDTALDVQEELSVIGKDLLLTALDLYLQKQLIFIKQNEVGATYASKITKKDAEINWNKKAIEIDRVIKAYNPAPVAYTRLHGQTIRIWQSEITEGDFKKNPGTIVKLSKKGIDVATGEGIIRILKCQLPNKKSQLAQNIINASNQPFKLGDQFDVFSFDHKK